MKTLLLGAGASVEAGVPAANQMARSIYAAAAQRPAIAKAIEVAIGGLRFQRSIVSSDPFGDIDVEDLYEVLRQLAERNTNILAPFVGSWSPALISAESPALQSAAHNATEGLRRDLAQILSDLLRSSRGNPYGGMSLGSSNFFNFKKGLFDALSASGGQNPDAFTNAASFVLQSLSQLSWITDLGKTSYLATLLLTCVREPIWIASLNYDNSIELAAKHAGLELDLGIQSGSTAVQFSDNSKLVLAKLHGSITWVLDTSGITAADGPVRFPALIFGSGNKLRIDGPYLELLFAFRSRLERTTELEVCGYSFRDQHINYTIVNWLDKDASRTIKIFDPGLSAESVVRNMQIASRKGYRIDAKALIPRLSVSPMTASAWTAQTAKC